MYIFGDLGREVCGKYDSLTNRLASVEHWLSWEPETNSDNGERNLDDTWSSLVQEVKGLQRLGSTYNLAR